MLRLFAELVPTLGLGYLIGRRRPSWTRPLALPLVRFGVPISLMGLLLRSGLNWAVLGYAAIAVFGILLMLTITQQHRCQALGLSTPTLQLGSCVGNTAYFGIPVALALLPEEALPVSIGYDFGATLLAWGLGPLWLARTQGQGQAGTLVSLLRHISESPASRGLLGALMVQLTPWRADIAALLWFPSRVVIVLALAVVGMRLGAIEPKGEATASRAGLGASLIAKLAFYPLLMLLVTRLLPLASSSRDALVLQAAAPTAISVLLMAEAVQREHDTAALLVLRSTLLALISVPLWWWLLQWFGTP
jgi:predicted permease